MLALSLVLIAFLSVTNASQDDFGVPEGFKDGDLLPEGAPHGKAGHDDEFQMFGDDVVPGDKTEFFFRILQDGNACVANTIEKHGIQ